MSEQAKNRFTVYGPLEWIQRLEIVRLFQGEANRSRFIRDLLERGLRDLVRERRLDDAQ